MQNPEFKLQISTFYCILLTLVFSMSAVIIVILPLNLWLRALFLAALAVYGFAIFRRYALLKAGISILRLKKLDAKHWQLATAAGVVEADLRGDSTVTSLVSVLRFDVSGQKLPVSCIIFRDALSADDYRRLVGVIRMGA